jgi:hypothetical protein
MVNYIENPIWLMGEVFFLIKSRKDPASLSISNRYFILKENRRPIIPICFSTPLISVILRNIQYLAYFNIGKIIWCWKKITIFISQNS